MTPRFPAVLDVRRIIIVMMVMALGLVLMVPEADAARRRHRAPAAPDRYGSIVIDADSGIVLLSDRPDRKLHPASLTKMMTLLLTFEALAEHRLRMGDYIRVSARATMVSPSKLGVEAGGSISVDNAIAAVAVKSANDIAVALAEALGGSESGFVKKMNQRARALGMNHTTFMNASGLPHPRQISTPRDMATLARYIITNYPQYYRYFGKRYFLYEGKVLPSHNKLMNSYPGMDGMKTGYVNASGYNLVASAKHGNRRLIGVVFGGKTAASRNDHMANLLDRGFKTRVKPVIAKAKLPTYPETGKGPSKPPVDLPVMGFALAPISPVPVTEHVKDGVGVVVPPRKPVADHNDGPPPTMEGLLGQIVTSPSPPPLSTSDTAAVPSAVVGSQHWGIQIGAYQSRLATDQAINQALQVLPVDLKSATASVAPLKTGEGDWLFRVRLGNLSQDQAMRACTYFRGCLLIAPEEF